MRPLITLTTDFGRIDPFVGVMKGVILSIIPNAEIVDLTHEIEPQNTLQAAWVLKSAYSYFPQKTIHLVVVDPGVGSSRRALAVIAEKYYFIGPDNGVLTPALNNSKKIYELDNKRYFLKTISSTFHGRDIFAPAAAWIGKGTPLTKMGKKIKDPLNLDLTEPFIQEKKMVGEIVYIDHFGNLISNISSQVLKSFSRGKNKNLRIQLGGRKIANWTDYYSQCEPGALGTIVNSWDLLEVFCRGGNAAKKLKQKIGSPISVSFKRKVL